MCEFGVKEGVGLALEHDGVMGTLSCPPSYVVEWQENREDY